MREDQLPGGGEVEQIRESKLLARDAASATGRAAVAAADGMVARGVQHAHHPGLESAQYAAICLVRVGREIECRTRLRLMRETISTQSACNQRRDRMSCSARPLAARASRPRSARSGMPETKKAMSVAMRVTLTRNQSCTLFCLMEEVSACTPRGHQSCNQGSSKSHASRNGIASFINFAIKVRQSRMPRETGSPRSSTSGWTRDERRSQCRVRPRTGRRACARARPPWRPTPRHRCETRAARGRPRLAEGIASSSSDAHQRQSVAIKGDRTWPKGSQAACEELSINGGVARQSIRGRHEERATPS